MKPPIVNGWALYAHPLFLDRLEAYRRDYLEARRRFPSDYATRRATKLYAAILKVMFEVIPRDPADESFRQGDTLGAANRHWFRAKFLQQHRLFFRYSAAEKVIVLAWLNGEDEKRAYGSKTDAYAVFRKMLENGNPPGSWADLMRAATTKEALARLGNAGA